MSKPPLKGVSTPFKPPTKKECPTARKENDILEDMLVKLASIVDTAGRLADAIADHMGLELEDYDDTEDTGEDTEEDDDCDFPDE